MRDFAAERGAQTKLARVQLDVAQLHAGDALRLP